MAIYHHNLIVIYIIEVYLSDIYCSNYNTEKQSIWRYFFQTRAEMRTYNALDRNMIISLFQQMWNVYSVSDDMQIISTHTSLYVIYL